MRLKKQAAQESEVEDFRSAVATLDAALTLWPDHPVNGNPELKEAKEIAQTKLKGQKLFEEGEQAFASEDFASAIESYGKAAELWTDNARIPEQEKLARSKLEAREKGELGAQQLAEGRPDLAVANYRLAWPLDMENEALLEAATACEKKFKAWEFANNARGAMKGALWAEASKSFEQAMLLDPEDETLAEPKAECDRKAKAMELVEQGKAQMELQQFEPAIATFGEALEQWPDNADIEGQKTAAVAAQEKVDQEKAAAEMAAAAAALLAMLDELRADAEATIKSRELDNCITTCTRALVLDHEQEYEGRGVFEALKLEAEEKAKALRLMTFGREQLAAKDFRALDTLEEALTLDPENTDIVSLRDEAVVKKQAREKQLEEMAARSEKKAVADAARKKIKKASVGVSWLGAAQHQAAELAAHLAEKDAEGEVDLGKVAAAAAATAAASLGPVAMGAARAAAITAISDGVSEEGAAAAGAAAANVVAAGLGKAAEEAGKAAAAKFLDDAASQAQTASLKKKNTNLLMKSTMYYEQVKILESALQDAEEGANAAMEFVSNSSDQLAEHKAEVKKAEAAELALREELEEAKEEAQLEQEMLQEELDALKSKEQMMMAILRKAGLAPTLDADGDGSVSKEEGEAFLADTDDE